MDDKLERVGAGAGEFIANSDESLQMIMALSDYTVYGTGRLARLDGEGELRSTVNAVAIAVAAYLKTYAFVMSPEKYEISVIALCPESDIEGYIASRAGDFGLRPEEVAPVCDVVVKNILLNGGRARRRLVAGRGGPRWGSLQIAESRIGGIRLTTAMLSALSRVGDIASLIGEDFVVMNYIIKSKVDNGTSDEVVTAFRTASEMIKKQCAALGETRKKVRTREIFENMGAAELAADLEKVCREVTSFVNVDLPARRDQFNKARVDIIAAGEHNVDVQKEAKSALARMQMYIGEAIGNLHEYTKVHSALMVDISMAARSMRSEAELGFLDFTRDIERRIPRLSESGLENLCGLLVSGIVAPGLDMPGLPYIGMFSDFKMKRRREAGPFEYDATPDEEFREGVDLNGLMKAVCADLRRRLRDALVEKGSISLSKFMKGFGEEDRARYFAADAVSPLIREDDIWRVGERLGVAEFEVSYAPGLSSKVRFDDFELVYDKEEAHGRLNRHR